MLLRRVACSICSRLNAWGMVLADEKRLAKIPKAQRGFMRLGRRWLPLGGGGWTPAQLFANGEKGAWYDPSDFSTGFQDSAGTTPQTASGQPTGLRKDKSGNALNVLQVTTPNRPTFDITSGVYSDVDNGTNSGLGTATFAAATLTNNMDLFVAIRPTSTANSPVVLWGQNTSYWMCLFSPGNVVTPSLSLNGVSGPIPLVNGVQLADKFSGTLAAALTLNSWAVVEYHNVDLSALTQLQIAQYTGEFYAGNVGNLVVCPAQSDAIRAKTRTYVGSKSGLSI